MNGPVQVAPSELFGDGVFETVHLRPDGPWLLDEHLDRLARSAALLDLPLPSRSSLAARAATFTADPEGALRIICTRASQHVTAAPIPADSLRERREGIRVAGAVVGRRPPWSLAGAKTLSYAENFAARRWARGQDADDALWFDEDGYALEAPTASVVWLDGDSLCTVPSDKADILPGTTAAHLLSRAGEVGLRPAYRMVKRDQLARAEAIWLTSALRGVAAVRALDGHARPRSPWTPRLLSLLGYPSN
jgi:4-amino-4-deoxychorismate lyase